ncbi:hypothetical protein LZL87_010678 [Fusarium oxysporum]|nr:hypothetical protein LZL87_010678 [Fusarium oxysporum]
MVIRTSPAEHDAGGAVLLEMACLPALEVEQRRTLNTEGPDSDIMTEQGHACRADSTENVEGLGFEEHAIVGNLRFDVLYTNGLQESLFQVFMPPVFVGQMRQDARRAGSLISEMCCRMYASDFLVKGIHHEGDEARFVVNRTIKFGEHPVPKAMQVAFQVNKTLLNLAKVALDVLLDIKEASVEDVEGLDVHVIKHAGLVEAAAVFKNLDFELRNAIIHIAEFLTYEVHNSLHHGLNLPIVWRVRLKARSWRDAALTLPIEDLSRSIANDTRAMPLAVNTIRFSTVFRQDWRSLAGCFDLAATTYYVLETDFMFHLAHLITPGMFAEIELMCPGFQTLLNIELVGHETWIYHNNNPEIIFESDKLRPSVCSMVRQYLKMIDLIKINGMTITCPFGSLHDEANANASYHKRKKPWTQGELREATSYCLKLISEAAPDEFAKYVYKSLPHWIGKYPAQDFVKLKFNLWDIPSREQVANMLELLDIGAFVWDLAATWHYAPVSFYDQVGKDVPQIDVLWSLRDQMACWSTSPLDVRTLIRTLLLHEDLPSVHLPSRHTQGLVPLLKENPLLRVERRASVFGCVASQRRDAIRVLINIEEGEEMLPHPKVLNRDFEANIYYWLLDTLTVVGSGLDTKRFTFVLEAGKYSDYCSELFQRAIQTDISKSKAWKICLETGLLASLRPTRIDENTARYAKDPRFEKLIELLGNQTSIFRCDFNPGVPLDVDTLVEDAKVRLGEDISDKWVSDWRHDFVPMSYELYYDMMVAPNYEFQTRQELIESRGRNIKTEDS